MRNLDGSAAHSQLARLIRERWLVSIVLSLVTLLIYDGFLLLLAFNPSFLAQKIGKHITLGIPIGVAVIVAAWLLTGVYVLWANNRYDKTAARIRTHNQL